MIKLPFICYVGLGLKSFFMVDHYDPEHRDEAVKLFSQSPFFSAWDPETLTAYINFGLYTDSSKDGKPIVRLKTSGLDVSGPFEPISSAIFVSLMLFFFYLKSILWLTR